MNDKIDNIGIVLKMKQKSNISTEKRNNLIFYICFMAIPIAQFLFFYIGVNFQSILLAFQSYDAATNVTKWVGLDNVVGVIKELTQSREMLLQIKSSFILFLVKTCVSMPLGLLFSFYIFKKFTGSTFFRIMLFLPSMISAIVLSMIFKQLADRVLPLIIQNVSGEAVTWNILQNPDINVRYGAILCYNVFLSFGVTVLMYVDAMSKISPDVVEAAQLDGATGMKEFFYITLPSVYPTIVTFVIINIANFALDQARLFDLYAQGANEEIKTIGYQLFVETYLATAGGHYDRYNRLAALGVVWMLVAVPITLAVRSLLNKLGPSEE